MGAVWLTARSEVRLRWRSLLALGLLGAVLGAVVVGAVVGARRTSTAYDRLVDATALWDVEVALADDESIDAIRALPSVRNSWVGEIDVGQMLHTEAIGYLAFISGPALGESDYRPLVVEGRMFDPDAPDEVIVSESTAAFLGWDVGQVIDFGGLSNEQYTAFEQEQVPGTPEGDRIALTVTGLIRDANDALPFEFPRMIASPAYHRDHAASTGGLAMVSVHLEGGAGAVPAFLEDVGELVPPESIRSLRSHHDLRATVDSATDVAARGLLVFAACAAFAALAALVQALNRALLLRREEVEVHRALGLDRRSRLAILAVPLSIVVAVATVGSAVGAALGSGLTPVGVGRSVEPHPGLDVNVALLALGALGVAAAMTAMVLATARHALRRSTVADGPERPSALVRAVVASGVPVPWVVGTRLAVEPGRGRAALPTRSALAGLVVGLAGVVASLSVVASLDGLFETPGRFGWNHDLTVSDASRADIAALVDDDSLAAVTEVREGEVDVDGTSVPALFLTPRKGTTEETLLEGRMPAGPDEVALGPELASELGVGLDGDVTVAGPNGGSSAMRVVGIALTESPGQYAGRALFDAPALERVEVRNGFTQVFVVIDPAADRTAVIDELARRKEISLPEHPAALLNLIQTRSVIRLFAVFLGVVAVAAIAHVLAVTTARRRRELAVLRALGLTGRQLGLSIGAMTMVLVTAGLLLGVPVGLVVSTVTWRAMTDAMHLPGDVTVPVLMIWLLACGAWVIGAVLSLSPARRAATLPASALRTE